MRAELGKTYAQIINGRCHWKFTAAELPEWNEAQIETVEVVGPCELGWVWDGAAFSAPVPTAEEVAQEADRTDRSNTYADPLIAALAGMDRQGIKDHIDATFPGLTAAQRNVLKAYGLAIRRLIKRAT